MIKKEYIQKIIKNIGKTFSIQELSRDVNPLIDSNRKL